MPRIIKHTEASLISYSVFDKEESPRDYLADPDLFRDTLPQPYRRIDRILQDIVDDAWTIIEQNENAKQIELSKPRPPVVGRAVTLNEIGSCTCMCASSDGDYLFLASGSSIISVDAATTKFVSRAYAKSTKSIRPVYEDENDIDRVNDANEEEDESVSMNDDKRNDGINTDSEIIAIHSIRIKPSIHLVLSLTSAGNSFMHLFSINKFYQIDWRTDKKSIHRRCELASNGELMALLVESQINSNDCSIEVYKLPRDSWSQFIESANLLESRKQNRSQVPLGNQSDGTLSMASFDQQQQQQSTASSVVDEPVVMYDGQQQQPREAAKPTLMCRMKPPANLNRFQAANTQNIGQLLKSTESSDVIGLGINNCLSKFNLDFKSQMAEKIFDLLLGDEEINQLNGQTDFNQKIDAEIKFLSSNKFIAQPIANQTEIQSENLNNVAVCWNSSSQVLFYPLFRLTKDLESKLEYCMPFASSIVNIKVTKCHTLMAVAFANGNLIVFDLNAGVQRQCVHFDSSSLGIVRMHFIAPSLLTTSYEMRVNSRLICLTRDGKLHVIDCSANSYTVLLADELFVPQLVSKDDELVDFIACEHLPMLLLTLSRTGKVYVFDIDQRRLVCELCDNAAVTTESWHQSAVCAFKSTSLYVKSRADETDEKETMGNLVYQSLRSMPILENYFNLTTTMLATHLPLNGLMQERIRTLMKLRSQEYESRTKRIKDNWNDLYKHKNI